MFGRTAFRAWGADYEQFMSPEQFRLFRDSAGNWMIEHCAVAKNATNVDGKALTGPVRVSSGSTVTLGKTGKCPVRLNLG